jgi:hypothetical protein
MLLTPRKLAFVVLSIVILASGLSARAGDDPATYPLEDVKPGLKGIAYTIFSGDQVEKMDVEVIGVLHNALGPRQDVIVVRLLGPKVEQTGVVSGMSGSPFLIDGKLVGAISLRLAFFMKEAIAGVTPIQNMMDVEKSSNPSATTVSAPPVSGGPAPRASRVPLPEGFLTQTAAGDGEYLVPIETPLISSGLYPETLARFSKDISALGMTMMAGGASTPSPEDTHLEAGDMVGIDLVRGDLSLSAGCTVTSVVGDRVLACGHPLFGFGSVAIPLSRAHVLMTLASSMASTKIISTGGTIGTLTEDRATTVMGKLGAGPPMIPLDVTLTTPAAEKKFHFETIESPQLTPFLVALVAFNGITRNPAYGEGSTLQLDGTIELKGHTPVRLEDLYTPADAPIPSGWFVAVAVQSAFSQIYSNPYEIPKVERINLRVTILGERRWAMIDNAWIEKSEVQPGETVDVKVLLRPYRGEPFVEEIPVTVPKQAAHGMLQLLISDAETLNRTVQFLTFGSRAKLSGLEELINLMDRERPNDRLYATLLQPTPTLLVEDKEMPNAPISEINVLDQRQNPDGARVLWQSTAGEWSVEMHQVIAGERTLTITVK